MLPRVSGEFTMVADPELRFTPSGMAVCNGRLVADKQKKEGDQWVDDKICWLPFTAFKKQAENIAESCTKGTRVIATGQLQTEEWNDKDSGEKRSKMVLIIDDFGVSLKFDHATVNRAERMSHGQPSPAPADDPWAAPPAASDEPPF